MTDSTQGHRFPLTISLLVALITVTAVAAAVSYYRYASAPPADVIDIRQVSFHPQGGATPPPEDDPGWLPISLPHDWRLSGSATLDGWYLFELPLNVPPNRLWGMYLPRLTSNTRAFLNDEAIGVGGRLTEPVARNWSRPLYFSIPNGVLHNGVNRFALRVKTAPGSPGYLGAIYLGPDELLRPVYERSFRLRIGIVENTTVALLLISALILGLWFTRPKDTLHGWFAAMSLVWGIHNLNILVAEIPVSLKTWEYLRYLSAGWFTVLLTVAMHRFIDYKNRTLEYGIYSAAITGTLILYFLPIGEGFFFFANSIWTPGALLLGVYTAFRVTTAWWQSWNTEYLIGICTGFPILLTGVHDWLRLNGFVAREHGHLIQYSAPVLLIGFTVILLMRYVRALNHSESLISTMEAQIEKKHRQLESNYRKMRKLEHEKLLLNERERIMRDMHDGVGGHLVSALSMAEGDLLYSAKLKDMLSNALMDLRLMIDSLDQTEGDLSYVMGTLRSRLQPVLENSGITMNWQVETLPPIHDLGPGKILQIMRILQEAITNVLKHSGARTLTVTTGTSENTVFVEVRDDGIGMGDATNTGHGLRNMRCRAEREGIILHIEDASPGTRVRMAVPQGTAIPNSGDGGDISTPLN